MSLPPNLRPADVSSLYEVVSGERPFVVFTSPDTPERLDINPLQLAVANTVYVDDTEGLGRAQVVIDQRDITADALIPEFMRRYERVVTPLQQAVDMEGDERADMEMSANAVRRTLAAGYKTLAGFVMLSADRDNQYGGLFVPEPMMGTEPLAQAMGNKLAANILPRIDEVRSRW